MLWEPGVTDSMSRTQGWTPVYSLVDLTVEIMYRQFLDGGRE